MKEYISMNLSGSRGLSLKNPTVQKEMTLDYNGKEVLVLQFSAGTITHDVPRIRVSSSTIDTCYDFQAQEVQISPYVVIPGYVLSSGTNKRGRRVFEVEEIVLPADRKGIVDAIKPLNLEGYVSFWQP